MSAAKGFNVRGQHYLPEEQVRAKARTRFMSATAARFTSVLPGMRDRVHWHADFLSPHVGIAYGAFGAHASLPPPELSAWERSRHPGMVFDHPIEGFQQAVVKPAGDGAPAARRQGPAPGIS
jgi:hypothetical protein